MFFRLHLIGISNANGSLKSNSALRCLESSPPNVKINSQTGDIIMAYKALSTEKYYYASLKKEVKAFRKKRNKDAVKAFTQFLFVLVVMALTFVAVQMMPEWLPVVSAWMEQSGVIETLRSWGL